MGCGTVAQKAVKQTEVTLCLERIQQTVELQKSPKPFGFGMYVCDVTL